MSMDIRESMRGMKEEPFEKYVRIDEFLRWKKEYQEFKARVEEKEKLISRFWLERAVYIGAIVAIATALVMIVV